MALHIEKMLRKNAAISRNAMKLSQPCGYNGAII
jgi:hypothetical protein